MQSEKINKENLSSIKWDNNHFKYCAFENFSKEGEIVDSDFMDCAFENIDWYGGIFTHANFIKCHFVDCVFYGTSFADARFVECKLENCRFIKDNLNAECDFSRAVAHGCSVNGGEGFEAVIGI